MHHQGWDSTSPLYSNITTNDDINGCKWKEANDYLSRFCGILWAPWLGTTLGPPSPSNVSNLTHNDHRLGVCAQILGALGSPFIIQKTIGACDVVHIVFLTNGGCCLVTLVSFSRKNILYLSRGLWNWSLRRQNGYQVPVVLSYPATRVGIIWQHLGGKPVWADCVAPSHEAMRRVSCPSPLLRWSRCQGDSLTHWRLASALEICWKDVKINLAKMLSASCPVNDAKL